ncbi:hypothetical protein, partial [Pseudarthrobacter sulfonivorans]|uniref:hypothetical protein n=1 Tax=Pseudarthrobacter sulfonivorans TaxID=121292 RepID=UPI00286D28AE
IEFSNNRHTRHHHNNIPSWIAPEQLFKLTRFRGALQIEISVDFSSGEPAPPASGTPRSAPFSGC